ncbi:hypothetical protein MACJ_000981 [Theileria orientalis]|uniref:Uncharacterized protein n=1 Tax=Theileria orientalis TaxID=68886 RepID=A0A976M514_THEOR|nr:hypothetical protein MACJ_000981 [Theileria orientalis]
MRNAWIIASVVVAVAVILAIGLSVGFLYKNRKVKSDTVTNEIIWSFHLENDSDLKINGNLDDVINVYILKKEGYSVGGNNASVNSFTHDFPTTKLTGWTHSYQIPLRIRKFIVGSNEVGFLKITPISGFAVFNNQDLGDFVTIWHDDDFHHYSKSGELISVGAFPFANGDKSIHPKGLKIPTRISEDANLDFNGVVEIPSGHDDKSNIEVTEEPEPKGVTVDTKNEFDTDIQLNELVEEPIEPEIASVSFNPLHGLPSGHDDKSNIEVTEGPEPEGVTVDTKNEFDTDIQLNELVEEPIEPEIASVSFNPLHGLPSGHDDKSNIEVTEGPEPEGVTVDTKNEFDTDIQLNELVEEPIEPEIASVSFNPLHGLPSGHDDKSNIEVTEGPEPEGVTVDTKNEFDTDIQLNELVEEPIEPEIASVSFNPLHGFPSGWHDRDVVEEPKPLLNGLYPDLLTTGWARDDLDIDPEPEPLLNGLYPDLLTTGWARDDLDIDPEPEPLLNGLYPDTLRTGWALDDLDKSKKRKTVYTDFDPSIGFPSGWHDRDIVEKPIEPGIESVSFNPVHGFPSGWHDRDIVEKPIEPGIESVSFNPVHGFPSGWHDRDIVEKQIEQDIESGDDEMIIKKRRIDDVFKKYICTLTNERSFRPQIRYLLSNFQLEVDDISEFELFVGEYDEPLLIRMKNSSGWNTYVHSGDNKWEAPYVPYLDINVLDKYYLSLRDDITTIDFSKTSGNYKFGKYRIEVTEPEKNDIYKHQGFKTYIHTIYHDTDYSIDFASVKVHRFKYDNIALKGFIRYHRIGKLYVYFWEHELTKPIYIRACADHGFANYFGYPNYVMQTDVYMFPYYLKVTNFEVNDALVINLARHEKYDFEGGVSPHLTRHQITVTLHDNSPIEPFRSYVHTLTVGGVNKPFSILRFLNEVDLNVDPTKVSSVEAYYHNKHLKKPLMFILNGSSKQTFYKLENDSYVKMDNLFSNLEITLKYLAYHNYNYVSIDVSKSSTYHYTGAAIISSLPDSNMLVSVVKEELNEFSKLTHSIKVQNKQSKFKLMALNGVDISFDDPELTSVDCYFFNEQMVTPLAFVLRGTNDLVYVNRKDQYVRKTIGNLDQSLDTLRRLVQYNLGIVYLRLDLKSNYYNNQDDGFNIEVSRGDKTHDGYTHYVHKFPSHKDARFLNGNDYFNPKVEPGEYEKADVFFESNKFPSIVSLTDTKGECYHFIFQNGAYKKAKAESVDKKLSSDSQTEPQEEPQSETHTPLLKPSIKPIQEQEQTHTPLLKPSLSTTPQVSPPPVPESPASQLITPSQTETHTPLLKPSVKPIQEHSPKLDQTPPPLPKGPPSIATSQPEPQPEPQTKLIRPSLAQLAKPPETPPPLPKGPPSIAVSQPEPQPEPQTKLIKLSLGQSQTETQPETQTQTKLIKPLATSQPEPQTQTKLIRPLSTSQTQSQPEAEKQSQTPPPLPKLPPSLSQ